jgi:predicted permease
LAGVSGLLGVAVAQVAVAVAPWLGPEEVPRLESASVDGSVLLFLLALVLACAVLLAVVPLASQLSPRLLLALREGGRGGTDAYGTIRLRRLLVGAQVALALVLLVGAGLAARSLIELGGVDLGIQGEGVVVFRVSVPAAAYATREEVKDFHRRAVEQLATLPGVLQAAAVNDFPLTGSRRRRAFELEDFPLEAGEPPLMFGVKAVKGSFFEALGIPLIEGRLFDASDAARGARNVLISDVIAERFFSERSPVGRRFVEDDEASGESLYFTIVGVVGSVREDGPGAPPSEAVYYPLPAIDMGEMDLSTLYYLLRTQGDPESLIEAARAEVAQLDRAVPISGVTTVAGLVRRAGARYRFSALLLGGSAALALGFAALGLYGVVCFLVTQRRREIGVRVALGASTGEIQGLVLREGTLLAIAGIGAGCLGAMVAARWLRALLFEISPFDPAVFLMVSVVLLVVCQAACVIPARRAARLEPIAALRED